MSVANPRAAKAFTSVAGHALRVNHATSTQHGRAHALLAPYQIPFSAHATLGTLAQGHRVFQTVVVGAMLAASDWGVRMVCVALLRFITAASGALCVMTLGMTWTPK